MPPKGRRGRGARGQPAPAGPSRGGRGGAGRGGGAPGALTPASSATTELPQAVPSHVDTTGVKRPGFGTGGRAITVLTNHYKINIPDTLVYHYDGTYMATSLLNISSQKFCVVVLIVDLCSR